MLCETYHFSQKKRAARVRAMPCWSVSDGRACGTLRDCHVFVDGASGRLVGVHSCSAARVSAAAAARIVRQPVVWPPAAGHAQLAAAWGARGRMSRWRRCFRSCSCGPSATTRRSSSWRRHIVLAACPYHWAGCHGATDGDQFDLLGGRQSDARARPAGFDWCAARRWFGLISCIRMHRLGDTLAHTYYGTPYMGTDGR